MSDIVVRICPAEKLQAALELVLHNVSPDQRGAVIDLLRPIAEQGVDVFRGLTIAEKHGRVVGAAWLQPQVGRTATLWPPAFSGDRQELLACRLAQASIDAVQYLPVDLVQVLLGEHDAKSADWVAAVGFEFLAELRYLMLAVPGRMAADVDSDLQFESPATAQHALLEELVQSTYAGTLDCPGLEGRRTIADTLAGYQCVGQHDPCLWSIVRWRGQPAGVLLVAPYPEAVQWELVYMGVVPEFRGHALGSKILTRLRAMASAHSIGHIVLAVDSQNAPALRMYEQSGFVEWARRTAYIKSV